MRAYLIHWLMDVCSDFTFRRESFHYLVNYIDRYILNNRNIKKEKLQLIGVVALMLAAKSEEVILPNMGCLV